LGVELHAVVARAHGMGAAAADPLRAARRALAGAAGALLLPRLAAATGDLPTVLVLVRALALAGQIDDQRLLEQGAAHGDVQLERVDLDLAGLHAFSIVDGNC